MKMIAVRLQAVFEPVEDIYRDIFGRRVMDLKCLMIIEVAVVEIVKDAVHGFLDRSEIDSHTQGIQLFGPNRHFDIPVVAVGLFTVSRVIPEMMARGKVGFYENIKHAVSPYQLLSGADISVSVVVADYIAILPLDDICREPLQLHWRFITI